MNAHDIIWDFIADQYWATDIALHYAVEYIDRQGNNEAFKDFLEQQVQTEEEEYELSEGEP